MKARQTWRGPAKHLGIVALALVAALLVTGCGSRTPPPIQHARDPLAASVPAEAVVRVLRLAGFERSAVGLSGRTVIVRVEIPDATSAADVQLAWQTGLVAGAFAFDDARDVVAQLFTPQQSLLQVEIPARRIRSAVENDDAEALRAAATFRLLAETAKVAVPDARSAALRLEYAKPPGAEELPEARLVVDVQVPGGYLDEKNRALGWFDRSGPQADITANSTARWEGARKAVPGVPATLPGEGALQATASRLLNALDDDVAGSAELAALVREQAAKGSPSFWIPRLRAWTRAVEAVSAERQYGSVLKPTAAAMEYLRTSAIRPGEPGEEPVKAAADRGEGLREFVEVRHFPRAAELDVSGRSSGSAEETIMSRVLDRYGVSSAGVAIRSTVVTATYAPEVWLGYRRADGRVFWVADRGGDIALTDGTITGWAYSIPQARLVDAERVGRLLETLPLG